MRPRFSAEVFTATFCVAYVSALAANLPLFLYYPQERVFSWSWAPLSGVGPGMAWYGLMAVAFPVSALVAAVAPTDGLPLRVREWLWILPACAMIGCLYLMSHFFLP
jgi:hypothetical protein